MKAIHIILVGILFAPVAGARDGAGVVWVELEAECEVRGTRVTLGDVARVDALDELVALRARRLELGSFRGARVLTFERETLQRLLTKAGISAEAISFSGAQRTIVRPQTVTIPGKRLERLVRKFAAEAVAGQGGVLDVSLSRAVTPVDVPAARYRMKLSVAPDAKNPRFAGLVNLAVLVDVDGDVVQRIPVPVYVRREMEIVVAKRRVPRGRKVSWEDLELEKREVTRLAADVVTTTEELIGLLTVNGLTKGQPVLRREVRQLPVIRKGDMVTARLHAGGLRIETPARAREAGAPGERIMLQNVETKKSMWGVVIDSRTVQIDLKGRK